MPRKNEGRRTRRNVLKLSGSALAATGALLGSASSASADSDLDFDPHSQEETIEFVEYLAGLSEEEGERTWEKLDEDQQFVIEELLDVDQVTEEVNEKETDELTSDSGFETNEITHTVVSTTEVPLSGWDLVDIWEFEQTVVWDYDGDDYENVDHSDSADILFPQLSFWSYQGVQDSNISTQFNWAEATMSGKFEFRFFDFGDLNSQTAFSGVRVYPDGTWEITEENVIG